MGLSSSKSKTKTEQTVKPITPDWLESSAKNYNTMIDNIAASDPMSFVAPTSNLQNQAYNLAGGLLGGDTYGESLSAVKDAANRAVGPVTASSYASPEIARSTNVSTGGALSQIQNAQGYDAVDPGAATQADSVQLKDYINDYQNPWQQQVVDTSLASFDDTAGRNMAALEANAARNNAFGGSRYAIERAQTTSDNARQRANLEATLRAQGYNTAAGLAAQDAGNRTQTNLFNAAQTNDYGLARTGWENEAARYGADANNQFAMNRAGILSSAAQANAAAANQRAMQQAALEAQAAQSNASMEQQASMFNATQQESAAQRALQAAALQAQIAGAGADLTNEQIALLAQLGNQQQSQTQAELTAPINLAQTVGALSQMTPYDILVGQQANGTSVTKSSPSALSVAIGLGSLFAPIKLQ